MFTLIKRGTRHALRIWNKDAKTRTEFHGIGRGPVSRRWRVEAKWAPYDPPKKIDVPTVIPGYVEQSAVPGTRHRSRRPLRRTFHGSILHGDAEVGR